jgi:hypothetical protein
MGPGPYYALGTIDTVPRAYAISRAYEGREEETITIKKLKIRKCNNNSFFLRIKIHHKLTCEVGSV